MNEPQSSGAHTPVEYAWGVCERRGPDWVLVPDSSHADTIPLPKHLNACAADGLVVKAVYRRGTPDWVGAQVDPAETAKRTNAAIQRVQRLQERDPGGDVTL